MARYQRVPARVASEVYHLNARVAPAPRVDVVEVSDAAVVAIGALFFGVAGALAGALLHL